MSRSQVHTVQTNLEERSQVIKDEFNKFLQEAVAASIERREREEQSMLN